MGKIKETKEGWNMDIFDFLTMLGGLSLFLFGMSLMGAALERRAGSRLRSLRDQMTGKPLVGFLTGLCVTAFIHSSSATTVMVVGFVKSIPLEIEEAAAIDGCGPLRTYFSVVLPMLRPTMISVGILEIMWVWNDYLLPYLVLDSTKYKTIPIHIQYLKGSYGTVDMGATMALIMLSILPVIIFYLCCQKHIIKGVAAGAVKG